MCQAPILPPELEHRIFRLAALSRPKSVLQLMLVAWRVKVWVEPILYRTLVMNRPTMDDLPSCNSDDLLAILGTKTKHFLREAVRNVLVDVHSAEILSDLVAACPAIENFFNLSTATLFADLRPRHFYGSLRDTLPANDPFSQPFWAHITHLELLSSPFTSDVSAETIAGSPWSSFGTMPSLTHLALDNYYPVLICEHLLKVCKALRVLVILIFQVIVPFYDDALDSEALCNNARFVLLELPDFAEDWQRGVLFGEDYWMRAEDLVRKRMLGQVERNTYCLRATS